MFCVINYTLNNNMRKSGVGVKGDTEICYLCECKKPVGELFLFDGVGIICIDRVQCESTCKEGKRGR